jgi:hypothetical protein
MLPPHVPVDGVICEISPGDPSGVAKLDVPTVFIFMPRDETWASKSAIQSVRSKLTQKGVASTAYEIKPFRLTPQIYAERLPEFFNAQSSKSLFDELVNQKLIGSAGTVDSDPRQSQLVSGTMTFLQNKGFVKNDLVNLVNANMVELYNAAWANHEMTHENVMDAIDFLLGHTKKVSK